MPMSPEDIERVERIAEAAAKKAAREVAENFSLSREDIHDLITESVRQTLVQIGIDNSNPLEMQQDFQHLRQWRRAGEDLRSKGMLALLTVFLTGLASLVLLGLKQYFGR